MNKQLAINIKEGFKSHFNQEPLLVFSPGRINLIGEHTDYNNGFVFPAAIDKGIVAAIQKSNSNVSSVIALDMNQRHDFSLETIQPIENGGWKNYVFGVVGELQKAGKQIGNFNLVFGGNIPNGAGVSSSAALENSVVFALNELFNLNLSKKEMIFISQKAEHNYVGVKCGIMDQYASMFGEKNTAILLDCESLETKEVKLNLKDYSLLLINTNVKHSLAESAYNERRSVCEKTANLLGVKSLRKVTKEGLNAFKNNITEENYQKVLYVIEENERVLQAFSAISKNDITQLGALLFASHRGLQNQYRVSCDELDFLVDIAEKSEAVIGARMMGGGFGGCTINLVESSKINEIKEKISKQYKNKFNHNCTIFQAALSGGTHLIKS